ncbi:fumarate hydratase, partial [bacterium]|nr:fumarate hydratase [bacterium]
MSDVRAVKTKTITDAVAELCIKTNYELPRDVVSGIKEAKIREKSELGKYCLEQIMRNLRIAKLKKIPVCQDTGMAVVFVEIGQNVHIIGGRLIDAINKGVRLGYKRGYLRKSIVDDPIFTRKNTGDNTPAVIHTSIASGSKIKITVVPKGFGSENMSRLTVLKPTDGAEGVKKFVVDTVRQAGANPCPPIIVGVGVGGTIEKAAMLSKRALIRSLNKSNPNTKIAGLEKKILIEINKLDIGPQGFGGSITALSVNIETYPTHIAGLPVAVNIGCYVSRHASIT